MNALARQLFKIAAVAGMLVGGSSAHAGEHQVRIQVRVEHGPESPSAASGQPGEARPPATAVRPEVVWQSAATGQICDLPMDVSGARVYVPVTVQGIGPLTFAFDTGSPETILDGGLAEELGLPKGATTRMSGAGEGGTDAWQTWNVNIEIDGVRAGRRATWTLPLDAEVGPAFGRRISGLVGNYLGKTHTVELDYPAGRIRLFDAERYEYHGSGTPVQVKYAGHTFVHAVVKIAGKKPVEGPFLMDSGAGLAVYLTTPTVDEHELREGLTTVRGVCGHGLGGEIVADCGRAESLTFAGFTLEAPIVVLSGDSRGALAAQHFAGIIGGEVLSRFKVVLDYSRSRVVFEPGPRVSEPFEFDMSGLWVEARGGQRRRYTITSVREGSAGQAAGLREGDVIQSVDGVQPVDLDALRKIFREDGRDVTLSVVRGRDQVQATLKLRREI